MARIILIEDDDLIRETTVELLALTGHEVAAAAADAGEALEKAADAQADLAIIDYSLPDMDGNEAATRLREIFPAIPIIISSGRRFDPDDFSAGAPIFFLQKPYDLESLEAVLKEALSG